MLPKNKKPFYIIDPDQPFVTTFHLVVGIISLPAVFFNLFLISFGLNAAGETFEQLTYWLEVFFGIEILLKFFTSYKDTETMMTVTSLKSIAVNYMVNGSFLTDVLTFFPY